MSAGCKRVGAPAGGVFSVRYASFIVFCLLLLSFFLAVVPSAAEDAVLPAGARKLQVEDEEVEDKGERLASRSPKLIIGGMLFSPSL